MNSSSSKISYCALLLIVLLIGFYATRLNHIYYATNGPFFDSCSYLNDLAKVVTEARAKGLFHTLQDLKNSTVFLPRLIGGTMGLFMPLTRDIAVWSQVLWLLLFALSLQFYLTHCRKRHPYLALGLTLPFLAFQALYYYNGGLSDFRMDLHLYLLLATASVWYLVTEDDDRLYSWLFFGCFLGLACLARATTPVYAVMMFCPLFLVRLLAGHRKGPLLLKALVAATVAAALSGWFYLLNFAYLRFYYVIWNADANAHLPILQALKHFDFAFRDIGIPVTVFALIVFLLTYAKRLPEGSWPTLLKSIHWQALYLGLAPILFLVFRGAGLNPFVSMPGAFGLTLFALVPFKITREEMSPARRSFVLVAASVTLAFSAVQGIDNHMAGSKINSMSAHKEVLQRIQDDAATRGKNRLSFTTAYCYYLNSESLWNCLLYEYGFVLRAKGASHKGVFIKKGPTVKGANPFEAAVPVDWKDLHGKTVDEKIDTMVKIAGNQMDYLIIPDDPTITFLETNIAHNYINNHVREFKKRLLSTGRWEQIGTPITNSVRETVGVYHKSDLPVVTPPPAVDSAAAPPAS